MFLLLKFVRHVFLFLIFESHKQLQISSFIKMKFVFQKTHKNPKHLKLWKIYMGFSYDYYVFRQQYKIAVLKYCCSFIQNSRKHFCIYCHLPLVCFCITHFFVPILVHASNFIKFAVVCTFAFASQLYVSLLLAFNILRCSLAAQ